MICITPIEGATNVLRVEGWLQSGDIVELQRVVREAGSVVALDLSELRMTNDEGIEFLRSLVDRGVELRHLSPLITLLLSGSQTNHRNSDRDPS